MTKHREDWFKTLMDSGVPKELITGFFSMISAISQSMTANPVAAAVGGGVIVSLCQKLGLIDEVKANLLFAAAVGISAAEAGAEIAAAIIPKIGGSGDANAYPDTLVLVNATNPNSMPDWSKLLPLKRE